MAIPRIAINNINDLKSVLDDLVPDFFASVTLDDNTITCKDEDGNTIFTVTVSGNAWAPTAYRSESSYLAPTGGQTLGAIKYCYKMGSNGAILFYDGGTNFRDAIAIAKAQNGKTAFVIPAISSNIGNRHATFFSACWGDDTAYTTSHTFVNASTLDVGNHCLLVPVPLFGSYDEPNYIPKVFALLVSQQNMRGIIQEVTSDSGTYITNGYVAMIYDAGGDV